VGTQSVGGVRGMEIERKGAGHSRIGCWWLLIALRQCDSLGQFKRLLKTHLFGSWDRDALWHFCLERRV